MGGESKYVCIYLYQKLSNDIDTQQTTKNGVLQRGEGQKWKHSINVHLVYLKHIITKQKSNH